jgi:hypothetical protein
MAQRMVPLSSMSNYAFNFGTERQRKLQDFVRVMSSVKNVTRSYKDVMRKDV